MKLGFLPVLGLIFIVLKLTGYIVWSWWLVTLPLYGAFILFWLAVGISVWASLK